MALKVEELRQITERVAGTHGLEVVDVEFVGGGKARVLRLYIDKPGGVTHADCALVSREVGTILDVEDRIPGGSYVLEVSSPGLDRKLVHPRDYERFAGSRVRVRTVQPVEDSRNFEGRLEGLREGKIVLCVGGGASGGRAMGVRAKKHPLPERQIELELSNIEKSNLVPEF
ncbi:MAG TPA: ribosome maturation factor RimP [Terriglobales bacterium]|nr:ribosome maturation factor RimP [Terriglobales bacterium]